MAVIGPITREDWNHMLNLREALNYMRVKNREEPGRFDKGIAEWKFQYTEAKKQLIAS